MFRTKKGYFAAAAFFVLAGLSYAQEDSFKYSEYRSPGKTFSCLLPAGWSVYESPDHSRETSRFDAVNLSKGSFEDRVSFSVYYFPAGSRLFRDMDKYVVMHSRPLPGFENLEGKAYGPVQEIEVKGQKARTWERTDFEYESHVYNQRLGRYVEPLHPRKVEYTERFVAMPARSGFVAFRFKARPDRQKQYEGVFSRIVDSFRMTGDQNQ